MLQAHMASKHTGQDRQAQKQGEEVLAEMYGSTAEPTLNTQHPGRCQLQGGPPFPKVSLRDQKCQLGNPGSQAGVPADTLQEERGVRLSATGEGGTAKSYDLLS